VILIDDGEPECFRETMESEEKRKWMDAMKYKDVVRSPVWRSPPHSCEGGGICWIFWTPFLCGVKAQMRRFILSHLVKWRGVRLERQTQRECDSFEGEK